MSLPSFLKQEDVGQAYEKQVTDLLYIVHRIAAKLSRNLPAYVSRDDLISLGTLGLMDALKRYDAGKGVKLETFVTWRIRGSILDGLRDLDPVPRQVREHARAIEQAYWIVESRELRSATDDELCDFLKITKRELHKRLYDISRSVTLSLDLPVEGMQEDSLDRSWWFADPVTLGPEAEAVRHDVIETISRVVDRLPDKERLVITLYYFEELAFREIAEILGLTVSRISQLHAKAVCRLRASLLGLHQEV
ncbi:MAG: sigD [Bacilli bacterium]|nr:sigD [Bacilli bacterium]